MFFFWNAKKFFDPSHRKYNSQDTESLESVVMQECADDFSPAEAEKPKPPRRVHKIHTLYMHKESLIVALFGVGIRSKGRELLFGFCCRTHACAIGEGAGGLKGLLYFQNPSNKDTLACVGRV